MKNKLLSSILVITMTSCVPENAQPTDAMDDPTQHLQVGQRASDTIDYKIVVIDGNEYFACRTHLDYWVLCPKLPPKKTK
jgi:hypothetical protein